MNPPAERTDLLEQILLMNRVHAALSSSLQREEVHTLILATLTTPTGLNFERAFLFLVDRDNGILRGHLGMGPASEEAAKSLRAEMRAEAKALAQIAALMEDSGEGSGNEFHQESLRGLQDSAYWIAMLQQYEPTNPLTQAVAGIEEPISDAAANGAGDQKPRLGSLLEGKEPLVFRREQLQLPDTLANLLADDLIVLPLHTSGDAYGLVLLDNKYTEASNSAADNIQLLNWFTAQTSLTLENTELFSDLQHAYDALKEVDKLKTNFISTISHELRTPLTAINGFVDLLVTGKVGTLPDNQRDLLRRVLHHGQNLTNIVNDLIEVAEVQSGGLEDVEIEVVDPLDCLMNIMPKLEPRRAMKDVKFDLQIDSKVPCIRSNGRILERIYYHLLDNAIKFIEDEGQVEVGFREKEGNLQIDIRDTGIGIAPERLRTIFDSFYQVNNRLDRDYNGLGIGLNVTKFLLDATHGTIRVASRLGEGSTFSISYPIADEKLHGKPRPY